MKDNKMIKYPFILGLIALVAGLLLALVYNITNPVIEKNKIKRENQIIIEMFNENVTVTDVSDTLNDSEKSKGLYSVLKVKDGNKTYYVYKVTFADYYDGDESSYVVAINNNSKIHKLKFTAVGDSPYASNYADNGYINKIDAMKREYAFKQYTHDEKEKIINNNII